MTDRDLQDTLCVLIENLIEARDEDNGGDDEAEVNGTLADMMRDMIGDTEEVRSVTTFERAQLLTSDAGIVLRMEDGTEFQISIVQSR